MVNANSNLILRQAEDDIPDMLNRRNQGEMVEHLILDFDIQRILTGPASGQEFEFGMDAILRLHGPR